MKRKTIVTISISGIIIVTLALLSLTYGYYLTRIQGNTNAKSVEVTSGSSKALYTDLTEEDLTQIITPGNSVRMKFSVKNIGDSAATYSIYLEDVVNEFSRKQDIQYTLYRKKGTSFNVSELSSCTSTGTGTCDIVTTGEYPSVKSLIKANETIKTPNDTYTYFFVINYIYSETESQDEDQGHKFAGKIQIYGSIDEATVNKFKKGTLAYAIFENAKNVSNGTELVSTPKTLPAQETSGYKYYTDQVEEATTETSTSISTTYQGYYWTYGTGYTVDENTGKFTLTGVATCKYNDGTCNTTLVGKYLVSNSASINSSSTNTQKTTTNLSSIYKVTTAPASSTSSITLKSKRQTSTGYGTEATLSIAEDDYGTSYYYRGVAKDNYIEFNNMCFRIVRIEGDGSIKIILAKEGLCSTITSSDTKSALINNAGTVVYGCKEINGKYRYDYENYSGGLYSTLKAWYTSSGLENKKTLLKNEKWCLGGSDNYRYNKSTGALLTDTEVTEIENNHGTYYYTAGKRLYGIGTDKSATFKCTGEENSISDYIGTITADEVAYAGSKIYTSGETYKGNYLYDNAQYYYWSLSRSYFSGNSGVYAFRVGSDGRLDGNGVFTDSGVRPAVTLATGAQIASGDGTVSNPYKIVES